MLWSIIALHALASVCAAVLLPSQDPFYTQPANISAYAPGDIINSRTVTPKLGGFFPGIGNANIKSLYQYLYRTTDTLGNPVAAVNSLLIPFNADPSKLVVYQTAYDSANNNCAPSYGLQSGANTTALADIAFIDTALELGWYVSSADYEGLNAQYVAGLQAGYATLDSVRSVFKDIARTGLSPSARYVMWGYSGGSLACEWAAELQPTYAPELKFQGAALGGLIPSVPSVLQTINGGPFAGLAFAGIVGLGKAYPDLGAYINANLVPSKKNEFYSIGNGCVTQLTSGGAFKDVISYFINGSQTLSNPISQKALQESGVMGTHGTPKIPLFIYKAVGDEVSPSTDTDKLVTQYCSQGATIEYHKDVIGEHITEAITGSFSALQWVADRLDGVPVPTGCRTEIVALTSVDIGTFGAAVATIAGALQALLGGYLGPEISG